MFFRKKKPKPPNIVYVYLYLDIGAIEKWVSSGGDKEIAPEGYKSSKYELANAIYWFPETDVHYHKSCNQFSHTIAGIIENAGYFDTVEWYVRHNYFVVFLPLQEKVIFKCPLDEIQSLVYAGKFSEAVNTDNLKGGKVIENDSLADPSDYTKRVLVVSRQLIPSLTYENTLVRLSVSTPSPSHTTFYSE